MTDQRTCSRPKCGNAPQYGGGGLCKKHYKLSPTRGYVDSKPVLDHISRLYAMGYTRYMVADHARIDASTITQLGTWSEASRVQKRIADSILAVPIPDKAATTARRVDALGTRRRVQALSAMGWSHEQIAEDSGVPYGSVRKAFTNKWVTSSTSAALAECFERLQWRSPENKLASRVARQARARGWFPPFAWDNIDNPDETPSTRTLSTLEWHAELAGELSDTEIARELGIKPESLKRTLERAS